MLLIDYLSNVMDHPRGEAPGAIPRRVHHVVPSLIPIQIAVEFSGAHTGLGP